MQFIYSNQQQATHPDTHGATRRMTNRGTTNRARHWALTLFNTCLFMTRHEAVPAPKNINAGAAELPRMDIEDWDALFTAVKGRLSQIGQTQPDNGDSTSGRSADARQLERVCAAVLECVDALDQLHTTAHGLMAQNRAGEAV